MLEHLGLIIDIRRAPFLAPPSNMKRIKQFVQSPIGIAEKHSIRVLATYLRRFAGRNMSVLLAVPLLHFYTRDCFNCLGSHYVGKVQIGAQGPEGPELVVSFIPSGFRSSSLVTGLESHSANGLLRHGMGCSSRATTEAGLFPIEEHSEHINLKELRTIPLELQCLDAKEVKSMLKKQTHNSSYIYSKKWLQGRRF